MIDLRDVYSKELLMNQEEYGKVLEKLYMNHVEAIVQCFSDKYGVNGFVMFNKFGGAEIKLERNGFTTGSSIDSGSEMGLEFLLTQMFMRLVENEVAQKKNEEKEKNNENIKD